MNTETKTENSAQLLTAAFTVFFLALTAGVAIGPGLSVFVSQPMISDISTALGFALPIPVVLVLLSLPFKAWRTPNTRCILFIVGSALTILVAAASL